GRLGSRPFVLAAALLGLITLASWGVSHLFSGRATYVQTGAMLGTMMVGNVFFVIIPAHRELVRAKQAGREPDPAANARGKLRSVHNNYLTLPVVFAMISNHFPFTYGYRHSWLILVALMAIGAWVRHYFNLRHGGVNAGWIPSTAGVGLVVLALRIRPQTTRSVDLAPRVSLARAQAIVRERCVPCHAGASAPAGVRLDTRAELELHAGD